MPSDDFDIDVEALAAGEEEEAVAPEAPPAAPPPAAGAPGAEARPPAAEAEAPVRAMTARKPSRWHRLGDRVVAPFARLRLPQWNLRTFLYLLLIVIILWFLLENWPPCRVRLLVWNGEAPKTVLFLFNLLLGALLLRWWQLYAAARAARRAAQEEASPEGGESEAA